MTSTIAFMRTVFSPEPRAGLRCRSAVGIAAAIQGVLRPVLESILQVISDTEVCSDEVPRVGLEMGKVGLLKVIWECLVEVPGLYQVVGVSCVIACCPIVGDRGMLPSSELRG